MAEGVKGCDDERRPVCSREYVVMPAVRKLDWGIKTEYSLPLKVPGQGHLLEKMWDERRAKKQEHRKKEVVIENLNMLENKAAFVSNTTLKSQMARLGRHVELGLKKAQEDLEVKRNKLRKLILQEDTAFTHEYVEKAQKLADEIYEEKKKIASEIVATKVKQQEEEARVRMEQLTRDNSEEIREKISIVKRLEAAEIQKHQICEKKIQLEREREYEQFWMELQKKRDEERIKYEEEEEKLRMTRIKEQREILNKQILGKLMMKDEMQKIVQKEAAFIDKLRERIKEEDEKEKEYKLRQRFEKMKIQQAQLQERRLLKADQERELKEFDDYYVNMLNEAIRKDKMRQMDTRAEVRKEAEFFQKQLVEIKAAQAEEDRRVEELRAQEVKKKEANIRAHQLALKEARDKLQRETLETWKQQVIHKQNKLEAERQHNEEANDWSRHILEKNKELDKLLVGRKRGKEVGRVDELGLQQEYKALRKERQILEESEFRKRCQDDERKQQELTKTFGTCFGPPHPFTKAILENQ